MKKVIFWFLVDCWVVGFLGASVIASLAGVYGWLGAVMVTAGGLAGVANLRKDYRTLKNAAR